MFVNNEPAGGAFAKNENLSPVLIQIYCGLAPCFKIKQIDSQNSSFDYRWINCIAVIEPKKKIVGTANAWTANQRTVKIG